MVLLRVYEAYRALIITRQRLFESSDKQMMRRYPWLNEPHLTFDTE
jgi:hypothetical protein